MTHRKKQYHTDKPYSQKKQFTEILLNKLGTVLVP